MVQIIPRQQNTLEKFLQALGGVTSGLAEGGGALKQAMLDRSERKKLGEIIGEDISDIRTPTFQQQLLGGHLKKQEGIGDIAAQGQTVAAIEKFFGPNAAELYPHLTDGGKTALFQALLLGKERGQDTNAIISNYLQGHPEEVDNIRQSVSGGEIPENQLSSQSRGLSTKAEEDIAKKEVEESEKYHKEIREKYQRAQALKPVFGELRESVNAGGTDALSWGNVADLGTRTGGFLGNTLNALGKAHESGDTAKFRTLSKKLLDEMKDIFGGQIRVKELEVFLSMLPEIGKSKEANLASIDVLEKISEASTMFYDTAQEIIQKNGGKIPRNLADQVQKQLKPVLSDLASDITQTTRSFEKQGRTLTRDIASEILKEARGDKNLARKLAKQRGYKF